MRFLQKFSQNQQTRHREKYPALALKRLCILSVMTLALLASPPLVLASQDLPVIGNQSSQLVSLAEERELGQYVLRSLRKQTELYHQPIVEEYFTHLVYTLAPASGVNDSDFSLVVLKSPALNAFAVPGSVMGINAGLFLHASTEQEFAAVIAHELAHLSQRHYARRLESRANAQPLQFAGILASILLGVTVGSDAGLAAYAGTQALGVEKMLSFSRENEQEADRLGVKILDESNFDPRAMPSMFDRMFRQSRLQGQRIPEYLSTHPLSENRVADTQNRANQYPRKRYIDNPEYHLSKSMIIADFAESNEKAKAYFEQFKSESNSIHAIAAEFGLAYLALDSTPAQSLIHLSEVEKALPAQLSVQVIKAQALQNTGEPDKAKTLLETQRKRYPDHYPTIFALAQIYLANKEPGQAVKLLNDLSRKQPNNIHVWEQLAEAQGMADNIAALHLARAEYFQLKGMYKQAKEQLSLAQKKSKNQQSLNARILNRAKEIVELEKNSPF